MINSWTSSKRHYYPLSYYNFDSQPYQNFGLRYFYNGYKLHWMFFSGGWSNLLLIEPIISTTEQSVGNTTLKCTTQKYGSVRTESTLWRYHSFTVLEFHWWPPRIPCEIVERIFSHVNFLKLRSNLVLCYFFVGVCYFFAIGIHYDIISDILASHWKLPVVRMWNSSACLQQLSACSGIPPMTVNAPNLISTFPP